VVAEQIVLVAARAFRALQAADQQNRHPRRHQDGKEIRIRRKPMNYAMHKPKLHGLNSKARLSNRRSGQLLKRQSASTQASAV
jgi:hypothetical protein